MSDPGHAHPVVQLEWITSAKRIAVGSAFVSLVIVLVPWSSLVDASGAGAAYATIANLAGGAGMLVSFVAFVGLFGYQASLNRASSERAIIDVARERAHADGRAQTSWELARIKLESYLNRNLDQVRAIFWLAALVMLVGFALIGAGVARLLVEGTASINPALVSAGSGILVEFIGASLLVIYRSTMLQAQGYMRVLERINAVGMSVQILEGIEDDTALRNKALVQVAERLLILYSEPMLQQPAPDPPPAAPPPPANDVSVG